MRKIDESNIARFFQLVEFLLFVFFTFDAWLIVMIYAVYDDVQQYLNLSLIKLRFVFAPFPK